MSFRIDYHKRHLFTIISEFYTTLDRKLISINSQKMSTLKRIIIKDFEWILLREIFILELLTIELFRRMENYSRTFPKKRTTSKILHWILSKDIPFPREAIIEFLLPRWIEDRCPEYFSKDISKDLSTKKDFSPGMELRHSYILPPINHLVTRRRFRRSGLARSP